ncbi:unnamed protein product [Lactuca saligna]|uniref:Uncharacterized protein n=1 Tax=Lactuca saligna TaxID=75948 RepID=A0AA35YXF4_LACSI|nr:unnamed protein product [Lactuca saligna]
MKQWTIHLASPLVTSPPVTSGLPHYKSTNDNLILITESFHPQLGVRLLHRIDDYECDSSTTPVIASCLTSLTATLIGLNHCSREILKLLINTSQVVSKGFCLNHFIERHVIQTTFSIYLTLKNCALNFFVMSNLSRPDLKQSGAMLDISNYERRVDHHRDMRMDIDHMSYEVSRLGMLDRGYQRILFEVICKQGYLCLLSWKLFHLLIKNLVSAQFVRSPNRRKQISSSTQELVAFFSETQEAVYTNSNRKVPKTEGGNNNMMIRVAAENQQGGVTAITHGEMPNNFGGNKSLYNDRVESFVVAAGEGQDRGGKLKDVAVDAHILSYCWSGDLIRSIFSSGDSRFPYVHSNDLVFELQKARAAESDLVGGENPIEGIKKMVLRSVSQWSAGTSQVEESIHKAYISLIEKAEHFIYIEVKLMEERNMKPLDLNLATLSTTCSKDLELNLAKSLLSEMGQCTTAYPYNQMFGALVSKN